MTKNLIIWLSVLLVLHFNFHICGPEEVQDLSLKKAYAKGWFVTHINSHLHSHLLFSSSSSIAQMVRDELRFNIGSGSQNISKITPCFKPLKNLAFTIAVMPSAEPVFLWLGTSMLVLFRQCKVIERFSGTGVRHHFIKAEHQPRVCALGLSFVQITNMNNSHFESLNTPLDGRHVSKLR